MIALLKASTVFGLLAFLSSTCLADLVGPPTPFVVTSADGSHYFKMVPDKKDIWNTTKAKGILYEVRSGKDKTLYTVSGWYAYQVFVSNDGRHLVRMGNWPTGTPKADDLALAFYVDGREIKRYSTLDLLIDPAKVPQSVSHYTWLQSVNSSYLPLHMFSLVTVENYEITFDTGTGEIKFKEPLKKATSK